MILYILVVLIYFEPRTVNVKEILTTLAMQTSATMTKLYSVLLFGTLSFSAIAQYCTSVGPSSTADSNVESVLLTGEMGNISYTGCPGVVGLQDLTATQSATLNAGGNYTVTVRYGTCSATFYSGAGTVWIDYDMDQLFETTEIIGTWQGSVETQLDYNFTVPAGATNGNTRMRVMQHEAGSLPLNPCGTFTWGSVTDFTIVIGNGIDCSGYIGDDTNDPVIVSSLPYTANGDNSYCYSNDNQVYSSPDVYYQLNPSPLFSSITVSLCGSSFDTFLSVIDGSGNIIAYNDDSPSCGSSSELTFPTAGLGTLYVIVEGWGNAMGVYDISINANYLNTEELSFDQMNVIPNPATNEIMISNFDGELTIMDLSGKVVFKQSAYNKEKIDISQLENGLYTIILNKDGASSTKKFIKQ